LVVEAWSMNELAVDSSYAGGHGLIQTEVPAQDTGWFDTKFIGDEVAEVLSLFRSLTSGKTPECWEVFLLVELQPLAVGRAVEVDREIGDTTDGPVNAQ
jgi:hypothetical protein